VQDNDKRKANVGTNAMLLRLRA